MSHRADDVSVRVLVLGAGPTGIGAAWRLQELSVAGLAPARLSWLLVDAQTSPGGTAASAVDTQGFTWDLGGHVIYSRYGYFDRFLAQVMGDDLLWHDRKGWVWMAGRFIPAPIQQNLHLLPAALAAASVSEVLQSALDGQHAGQASHYAQWIQHRYGATLADAFFLPHSRKMWGHPLEALSTQWVDLKSGSRSANVPGVDLARLFADTLRQEPFEGWRQSPPFPYPVRGGSGELWRRAFARLPGVHMALGKRLVSVDTTARRAVFDDGSAVTYQWLISSLPLPRLAGVCQPRLEAAKGLAGLRHSSVHMVGLGFRGATPERLRQKYWIHVPDPALAFFRISVLSNYAPNNTPVAGEYWSVLCEAGFSDALPLSAEGLIESACQAVQAMLDEPLEPPMTVWQHTVEFAYPVPTLGRDALLNALEDELGQLQILSRGRFGAWKYEGGNQDSSFMQGVEAADRALFGTEELTCVRPELIGEGLIDRVLP